MLHFLLIGSFPSSWSHVLDSRFMDTSKHSGLPSFPLGAQCCNGNWKFAGLMEWEESTPEKEQFVESKTSSPQLRCIQCNAVNMTSASDALKDSYCILTFVPVSSLEMRFAFWKGVTAKPWHRLELPSFAVSKSCAKWSLHPALNCICAAVICLLGG